MTIIQIDDSIAHALQMAAEARGLTLDAYLRVLSGAALNQVEGFAHSAEQFEALLREHFAEDPQTRSSSLPADFSRADIYAEHD